MQPARHTTARRLARLLALTALAFAATTAAQAALITFDELAWPPPDPDDPSPPCIPITTQYADLGVIVSGGLLSRSESTVSPPHALLGGNPMSITFTGTLPRYVSFYITSTLSDGESWVVATGPGGYSQRLGTGGWPGGDSPHPFPYPEQPVPNTYVSFASATGIAQLDFFNAYQQRFSAVVDNLYFGAVPAVPEPAPFALAAAGLACLGQMRKRRHSPSQALSG